MTATTPSTDEQIVASLRNLTPGFGTEEEAADRIESLADALAAVTADRDQARQMLAEKKVVEVHHYDIEAHAASFNQGWDEAVRQGLAAPRIEAGL